ncbi:MAG: transketolase [Chloroflexi bacterium]|nr:transketolase [Chloroflexota bacterium]
MSGNLDEKCINTLRFLAVDAIQKASSGHPGTPLGATPAVYTLWDRFLKHNPQNPQWPNRDRFILSAGHASAMLYALLYMSGYNINLDDLKNFRQKGYCTAGHPEYGHCIGVEATTGPLGQGFAMGVGMAIAESHLAEAYNRPDYNIIDHFIYVFCSDGDLMEGISSEAASLAGTLKLGKLIYLYDDNKISIEGDTASFFNENVKQRFEAFNFQVIGPIDGMNVQEVQASIKEAQQEKEKPSLIICRTIIGYGSPNRAGKAQSHGEPLGETEVALTKKTLGWDENKTFYVPPEAKDYMDQAIARGLKYQKEWQELFNKYQKDYPSQAKALQEQLSGQYAAGWNDNLTNTLPAGRPLATREASGLVLNELADRINSIIGGSADLGPSNKTKLEKQSYFSSTNRSGRNMQFGVREQAMGAITNGMALHGGITPYCATFLAFYDYMRAPIRLAALMGIKSIFIFSHDSIGMGEDGPTHQPVEQILGLRSVPRLLTLRPCDSEETVYAWQAALSHNGPSAIITTRQKVPYLDRSTLTTAEGLLKGAYTLWQSSVDNPQLILISSGSEVALSLDAARKTAEKSGKPIRLVSMPSWELFEQQSMEYQESILPSSITKRISIEAASTMSWQKYAAVNIGVDDFGISAPANEIYEYFGITQENIVIKALELLK